jgi:predicted 2-oxoglutarate/Fe(II)-dependent dioxygenase YbiX
MAKISGILPTGGKSDPVDVAFNRAGVFSAEECHALLGWAEAGGIAGTAGIDRRMASQEFVRRHKHLEAARATRDRAVARFRRKLLGSISALNERIWRFHVTRFSRLQVLRYEIGDEVGLHIDLDYGSADRKLVALVQLSTPDAYDGGVLRFGLSSLAACREPGSLLVFPAWMPHQVTPVTGGVRYSAFCAALGPSFR